MEVLMGKNTAVVPGEGHEVFVRRMIDAGRFAFVSEAIRTGMDALMERDAAVER
jgi:Arc/MetJ-type ribon-helix-helix transcriptional regulator